MPFETGKLSRSSSISICKEYYQTSPSISYYASQKLQFYDYKLLAGCSVSSVFSDLDLSQVSIHDIHYLKNTKNNFSSWVLIDDKEYLSTEYQPNLFTSNQIRIEAPMRVNQHEYQKQLYLLRKTRKRIETLFSQLCDQFLICRNYAKSFDVYKNRIISKITSLTVIQMINRLLNRNINNIKSLVV